MGYVSKEGYERKREWAAERMAENKTINTLTDKQHEALEHLVSIRHKLHSNQDSIIKNDQNKVKQTLISVNIELNESGLNPMSFIPDDESEYIDIDTINELYDIEEVPEDEQEWQDWYDTHYYRISNELEELNKKIEIYLQNIDDKYKTNYAPSGASRIFALGGNISSAIEERLRKKQEAKEFKDTSGRVSGTRKEMAAYKMIMLSDMDKIEQDESTAIELVKKDKVYPRVDIVKEQEKGVSAGAAFLKVKLRESFGAKPPNNAQKRKVYVGYVEYLVNKFADVVTVDEFEKMAYELPGADEGFITIVGILNPDTKQKMLNEADELQNQKLRIQGKMKIVSNLRDEELAKIRADWKKDNPGSEHEQPTVTVQTNATIYKKWNQINEAYSHLSDELTKLQKQIIPSIQNFIINFLPDTKAITYYYNAREYIDSITQNIFEDIFGNRFINFCYRKTPAISDMYEQARQYEPISEEQSKIIIAEKTKWNREVGLTGTIAKIEILEKARTRERIEKFFAEHSRDGQTGYWNHEYKKHIYWQDIHLKYNDSGKLIEWYREKVLSNLQEQKVDYEKSIKAVEQRFRTRDNDWSWSGEKKSGGPSKTEKAELQINEGVPLSYIKRTGGYEIIPDDVQVQTITEKFGFKTVTLGNYVKDDEAREHIRHFLGAMSDLGEMLNMDLMTLNSLNRSSKFGGLSLWFGAGGAGGRALAWYRANGVVINLTKKRGDGTVCHEYGHYLDNALNYIDNPKYDVTNHNFIWGSVTEGTSRKKYYKNVLQSVQNEVVQQSMRDIFNFIYNGKIPGYFHYDPFYSDHQALVDSFKNGFARPRVDVTITASDADSRYMLPKVNPDETIDEYFKRFSSIYSQYQRADMTSKARKVLGDIVRLFGLERHIFSLVGGNSSSYYTFSSQMSSEYWIKDWELFARAFETYMYDKLAKTGRVNNYLVSGGMFEHPARIYPMEHEREVLFHLYENLFDNIKTEYSIPDFVPIRTTRADEYIVLKEKDNQEVTESGVITETEEEDSTEEVLVLSLREKLSQLSELLSRPQMKRGGKVCSCSELSDLTIKHFNI